MSELGGSPAAAKALLHRMTRYGQLDLERRGRVGVYRLAGQFRSGVAAVRDDEMPTEGTPAGETPGSGAAAGPTGLAGSGGSARLHLLIYDLPERQRSLREAIRTTAFRHGYRALRPGVLVGTADRSANMSDVLTQASVHAGWWELSHDGAELVLRQAFNLDALAANYRRVADGLRDAASSGAELSGADALRLLYRSGNEAYILLMSDAQLPHDLLPADWPLGELVQALGELHQVASPAVDQFIAEVVAESGHQESVEADPGWR